MNCRLKMRGGYAHSSQKTVGVTASLLSLWVSLWVSPWTVACTRQGAPRQEHELAKVQAPDAKLKTAANQNLGDIEGSLQGQIEPQNLSDNEKKNRLRLIQEKILNSVSLRDSALKAKTESVRMLGDYNAILLTLFSPSDLTPIHLNKFPGGLPSDLLELLNGYEKLVLQDCDQELKGCTNIEFFSQDPRSSEVLNKIAETKKDLTSYYKSLFLSIDLRAIHSSPRTYILFMARLAELTQYLEKMRLKEQPTNLAKTEWYISERTYLALATLIGSITRLKQTSQDTQTQTLLQSALSQFNPWENILEFAIRLHLPRTTAIEILAKNILYSTPASLGQSNSHRNEGRELSNEFKSYAIKSQSDPDRIGKIEAELRSERPSFLQLLGVAPLETGTIAFFIVDQVYREKLDIAEAQMLWQLADHSPTSSDRSTDGDVEKTAVRYIQILLQNEIEFSSKELAQLISQARSSKSTLSFRTILQQPRQSPMRIKRLLEKTRLLQNLSRHLFQNAQIQNSQIQTTSTNSKTQSQSSADFRAHPESNSKLQTSSISLDDLGNNLSSMLNTLLVTPHTLALLESVIEEQKEIEIQSGFVREKMTAEKFVASIYRMDLKAEIQFPWMEYGNPRDKIDHLKLQTGFASGLNTGVFYHMKIDPAHLLTNILHLASDKQKNQLREELKTLALQTEGNEDWIQFFKPLCHALESGKEFPFSLGLYELEAGAYLGSGAELIQRDYQQEVPAQMQYGRVINRGPFLYSAARNGQTQMIIDGLEPLIFDFKNMLQEIENQVKETKGMASGPQLGLASPEAIANAHAAISDLESVVNRFKIKYLKAHHEFSHCFFTLLEKELDVRRQVMRYEYEFFKQMHRDMLSLRQNVNHSELLKRYNAPEISRLVQRESSISARSYTARKSEMLIRIKHYLEVGIKTDTQELPPLAPNVRVDLPKNFQALIKEEQNSRSFEFQEKQNDFVLTLLKKLHTMDSSVPLIDWNKEVSISSFTIQQGLLATTELARMSFKIPNTGDAGEQLKLPDPQEILNYQIRMARLLSMSEQEDALYQTIGRRAKFDTLGIQGLFMKDYDQPLGYADGGLEFLSADMLGEFAPNLSGMNGGNSKMSPIGYRGNLASARKFALSREHLAQYPFARKLSVLERYQGFLSERVQKYFSGLTSYQNTTLQFDQSLTGDTRPIFNFFTRHRFIAEPFSSKWKIDLNVIKREFDSETGSLFLQTDNPD